MLALPGGATLWVRVATASRTASVVEDADDRRAGVAALADQVDHAVAVGDIERGGRLVEQQHRIVGDEPARDVDALLLAAGEGRGRQRPQPLGDAEQAQQELGTRRRASLGIAPSRTHRLGHHVERGDARDDAQELADEAHGVAAHVEHDARLGARQVDPVIAMAHQDRADCGR